MDMMHKQVSADAQDMGARTVRFRVSDEAEDRDGDVMIAEGVDFKNFGANPQFLGFHNSRDFPLGIPRKWWIDKPSKSVMMDVYFPTVEELSTRPEFASEKAKQVDLTYNMYKMGMLKAVSVGFIPTDVADKPSGYDKAYGKIIKGWELLEVSAVPLPANPEAVEQAVKSFGGTQADYKDFFSGVQDKGVIPFNHYPLADEKDPWDAARVIAESEPDELKVICTWYGGDGETKSDFKLPHHLTHDDGYKTVWKGVAAAMAALLGSRGGVKIPEADKDKCYAHLKKHYEEFGKTVPDKSVGIEYAKAWDDGDTDAVKTLDAKWFPEVKSGRKISAETRKVLDDIRACHDEMKACMKSMKACHAKMDGLLCSLDDTPDEDDGNDGGEDMEPEKTVKIIIGK